MSTSTTEEKRIVKELFGADNLDDNETISDKELTLNVRQLLEKLDWEGYKVVGQSGTKGDHIWTLFRD